MYHEAHGVSCVQPNWSCNSVLSSSSTGNNSQNNTNMMSTSSTIGSSNGFNGELYAGTHIDEDFLIEDLSEFSNDDIAAPIKESDLDFSNCSLQRFSDVRRTSSPLHRQEPALLSKDDDQPCLPFPCQDVETAGYDWLSSFGTEDNLIYGASNIDVDSFLLSSADPFGGNGGLAKIGNEGDESKASKDLKAGKSSTAVNIDDIAGEDVDDDADDAVWDKIMSMPITGGRAPRSKRARSAGWSSASSTLCNSWSDYSSPTNSLDSTSNLSRHIIPIPASRSSCTFAPEQDESHIGHVPSNPDIDPFTSNPNIELSASRGRQPNSDMVSKEHCKTLMNSHIEPSSAKEEDAAGEIASNGAGHGGLQPRRCTHCLSQKTPQWRAGPEGPKTLCNACGVRYKSGRLFDEYRPAKSPTFLSYKHSNSHKKVMEMRRRKALHYQHHQHYGASHVHRAGVQPSPSPATSKKAWVDDHQLANKLKIKLHQGTDLPHEPYSHFSDVTLISSQSNRAALLDSPARFLY